jgi:nucleotide-binding universal stress UspA family protein
MATSETATRARRATGLEHRRAEDPRPRTVVCGVDDGKSASDVVRLATDLGEELRARIVLVHVLPASGPGLASVEGAADALRLIERERAEDRLAELAPDADRRVEFGAPASELARVAREEHADLVVVGSRGRGALATALLGSVSTQLARSAPCPVLVLSPLARAPAA